MYRLTVCTSSLNENAIPTATTPQQQRVYRWGQNWGIYRPSTQQNRGGAWRAEKRTTLESNSDQLFERVDVLDIQSPPVRVEDMWDEEIIVSNNVEYNGLISICATAAEIKRWCTANKIPVLKAIEERAAADPVRQTPPQPLRQASQYLPTGRHQGHAQRGQHFKRPPTAPRATRPTMCLIDE